MESNAQSLQGAVAIPDDFDAWDEGRQVEFARDAQLDARAQEVIAEEGAPKVRESLARNPSLTEEWQEYLYTTGDGDMRLELSRNSNISNSLQNRLAGDDNWRVRAYIAENENISSDAVDELLLDDDNDVLASLAGNPKLEEEQQEELFDRGVKEIKIGLAGNANLSVELEAKLCQENDEEVMHALAERSGLSLAAQTHIVNSIPNGRESAVLEGLARNPSLKIVYQRQLAERGCVFTILSLLKNPSIREKERQVALQKLTSSELDKMQDEFSRVEKRWKGAVEETWQAFKKWTAYDPNTIFGSFEKHDALHNVYENYQRAEDDLFKEMLSLGGKIEFFKSVAFVE